MDKRAGRVNIVTVVPAQRVDITSRVDGKAFLKWSAGRNTSTVMEQSKPHEESASAVEKTALGKSTEMANLLLGTFRLTHGVESRRRELAFADSEV